MMASALLEPGRPVSRRPSPDTARSGARFVVLDGTPEDHPQRRAPRPGGRGLAAPVAGRRLARRCRGSSPRSAAEVERRQQPDAADGPEIFLFIHDLAAVPRPPPHARTTSASRAASEDASPADHLDDDPPRRARRWASTSIVWCDTVNNLNRTFDHQALREFEMRVLFQMSPTDSGHLLDSPHASKLGPNRALFFSEEQNRLEKFRPYGLPSEEWLGRVREQFSGARRRGHLTAR